MIEEHFNRTTAVALIPMFFIDKQLLDTQRTLIRGIKCWGDENSRQGAYCDR